MKKYHDNIDLVRIFMAIGVLGIHTDFPIIRVAGRLAVPFFFITSSYLFFCKYKENRAYLPIYLKKLFLLYIRWQILFFPFLLFAFKEYASPYSIKTIFLEFLKLILIGGGRTGWVTSWYLFALFYGILIINFLLKYLDWKLLLFISIIHYLVIQFSVYNFLLPDSLKIYFKLPFTTTALVSFPYIMVGYYFSQGDKCISNRFNKMYLIFFTCSFMCLFVESFILKILLQEKDSFDVMFFILPTTLFLFAYLLTSNYSFRVPYFVREFSSFLYFIHVPLQKIISALYPKNSLVSQFFPVLIISIFLYFCISILSRKRSSESLR